MSSQATTLTQSSVIIVNSSSPSNQNAAMAVNIPPNVSGIPIPMALQMPGLATVPGAACDVNPQQQTIIQNQTTCFPVMNPQQHFLQPANTGGGFIVLNVGNGNNLAAAINQLVSSGLVQQQQPQIPTVQQASIPSPSIVQTAIANTCISNNQYTTSASSSVNTVAQALAMDASMNRMVSQQMNHQQQSMAMSQSNVMMNAGGQMQLSVPTQQPAAFMLVPIPQMPDNQNPQLTTGSSLMNLGQQPQPQPILINFQNQVVGTYPTGVPMQNVPVQMTGQGIALSQQQAASLAPGFVQTNLSPSPMLNLGQHVSQTLPKSNELRSYLTKSTTGNVIPISQNVNPTQVQTIVNIPENHQLQQNQHASMSNAQMTSVHQVAQHSVMHSPSNFDQGHFSSLVNSSPRFQPSVSSPGLAFLAQVSSLSASQATTNPTPTCSTLDRMLHNTTNTTVPGHYHPTQTFVTHEVNNNILPMEEVKQSASVLDSPGSSMTVSSTTKIGDESISGTEEFAVQSTSFLLEVPNTPEFHSQVEPPLNVPNKKGAKVKRKKEASHLNTIKEKRKKGPAPKLNGTELCLICGDRASGFHYNTLSCEGCKGFFRRSVIKGATYKCKLNGDCHMDLYMRRKCQKCRFEKCKTSGMREQSVLSEEQMKAKKLKRECDSTLSVSPTKSLSEDTTLPALTSQQRRLLELLKANERRFQWPTTEDMKKVTVWVEEDDSAHSRALRFAHFTELCILIVQLVVEFTKQLPGFLEVLREDQIVLLKACAIEVMLLRAAKQYNKHDGTINFLNGKLYDKSSFYRAGMQVEFVDPIFHFCKSMAQLDLDETEYAILVAINTFSTDRPHIKDIEKVECMQDPYVDLLRVYSRIRHPNDPLMFARILMKIVELRTLNNYHSEQMFALKVQDQKLPPLLAEIWDM